MPVSSNTQAILLLTSHFTKSKKTDEKPLTPKEWGRFALWLKEQSLLPERLMTSNLKEVLEGWSDKNVTLVRLEKLLNRGSGLALAMDKWLRAGLWVLTRADDDYPIKLKNRLKTDSPAALFGCGNPKLLNQGGVSVVGSRNASDDGLTSAKHLGSTAAQQGYSIVSGGARGVDEVAMLGALEAGGTVIGILANNLLRASSSAKYRDYLMNKDLVLVSPFYPEAGFNPGNAMARNKYIYCLSDVAVVVHSGAKGGTWSGALENLRRRWVPLWVMETADAAAGNAKIVSKGACWLKDDISELKISSLISMSEQISFDREAADLVDKKAVESGIQEEVQYRPPEALIESVTPTVPRESGQTGSLSEPFAEEAGQSFMLPDDFGFYELFLFKIREICQNQGKTRDELAKELDLRKGQLDDWLKRAVKEKKLEKLAQPVRYKWNAQQEFPFD
jgi:predicted Rossmann fold nucleotide-binding protein DprA/Smf involved in DNA uptake